MSVLTHTYTRLFWHKVIYRSGMSLWGADYLTDRFLKRGADYLTDMSFLTHIHVSFDIYIHASFDIYTRLFWHKVIYRSGMPLRGADYPAPMFLLTYIHVFLTCIHVSFEIYTRLFRRTYVSLFDVYIHVFPLLFCGYRDLSLGNGDVGPDYSRW